MSLSTHQSATTGPGSPVRRARASDRTPEESGRLAAAGRYGLAVLLVATATGLALAIEPRIAAANLTLVFVLPVVIAASSLGWRPSLLAVVASVLAFDFFFTEPLYSIRIDSPSDLWATGLLAIVAAIVCAVSAQSRRQAAEARQAADRAQALQALAHKVIHAAPPFETAQAAADALARSFAAPAAVFLDRAGGLRPAAVAGGAEVGDAEAEAALDCLGLGLPVRGRVYPHVRSRFDVWPVAVRGGGRCAVGVDFTRARRGRPQAPEQVVDAVAAYLAAGLAAPGAPATP